jgi:hypothetical protein
VCWPPPSIKVMARHKCVGDRLQVGPTGADGVLCPNQVVLLHANEGPVRIQYNCLVPIYVFQEMKLRGLAISKTEL